jgi:hypothetical protein
VCRAERGGRTGGGPPHYIYEAWIGCGGEGFARSSDGGAHFSKPITLPDSSGSDDPAVAVAPDGTVYVSYLRYHDNYAYSVVAASFDHGASFSQASSLIPHVAGNFIAAGRGGTVYVTWDYGPSAADVQIVCSPSGSRAYGAVDATAVVQKSTNHGKTWGPITPMQPGLPGGRRLRRLDRRAAQRGGRRPDTGRAAGTARPWRPGARRPELGQRRRRQQELGDLRHDRGAVRPGP